MPTVTRILGIAPGAILRSPESGRSNNRVANLQLTAPLAHTTEQNVDNPLSAFCR